ncbi:MAG: type II toxin-antitoxin system RelE/ParE family toxin [Selenomonadaceae bacterium]|nr:type II toxin-antitoxin system RelE/ParE family toxin [Selenomonadaceae bacterium]MBR3497484.1 type II toxin-antitoxin system RelE/ParE family toxin [Selenomonadaceae bacterium]
MKSYTVKILPAARKKLKKMDSAAQARIVNWLERNLEGCENPRRRGKALHGELKNLWRYRVGDYRIVADIQDDKIIIFVINVDKRNDIYK